jgi:hypothetical protein
VPVALDYRVTHVIDGKDGVVLDRRVVGDRIEEALADDVRDLLASSFRPEGSDKLVLKAAGRPQHTFMGLDGPAIRRRHVRRSCEALWPPDSPAPEVHRKAAFLLLQDRRCTIRVSPFAGLVASRD